MNALAFAPLEKQFTTRLEDIAISNAEIIMRATGRYEQLRKAEHSAEVNYTQLASATLSMHRAIANTSVVGTSSSSMTNAASPTASIVEGRTAVVAPKNRRAVGLRSSFWPLQEWEGYVREVRNDKLIADLRDLTRGSEYITEQAEIPLEELSEAELQKAKPGSVFRWAIGYQRSATGSKMRVSNIIFRDLPAWTKRDWENSKRRAAEMAEFLRGGSANAR